MGLTGGDGGWLRCFFPRGGLTSYVCCIGVVQLCSTMFNYGQLCSTMFNEHEKGETSHSPSCPRPKLLANSLATWHYIDAATAQNVPRLAAHKRHKRMYYT